MHDVIVRAARVEDVDAIAALSGELGYPSTPQQMAERMASLGDDAVLVAEADGRVAGWIQVAIVSALESGTFAEIRGLVVTESMRGAGVGAKLVESGERWAAERGLTRMRVRSNVVRERTHGFYEKRGYRAVKTQKVFDKSLSGIR